MNREIAEVIAHLLYRMFHAEMAGDFEQVEVHRLAIQSFTGRGE